MLKTIFTVILSIGLTNGGRIFDQNDADGYHHRVVSFHPSTDDHRAFLGHLENREEYEFWTRPKMHRSTDVMVNSEQFEDLISFAKQQGIEHTIKIHNVESLLEEQHAARSRIGRSTEMGWDDYRNYDEIAQWLNVQVSTSPVTTIKSIGNSTENRPIYQAIISTGANAESKSKPIVYIDGNIHAREWISGAVATYIINELAFNTAQYTKLLDQFDFYIVPILNPDGYAYTHEQPLNVTYRNWRKTRTTYNGTDCIGADPNRNFPFHFGGEGTGDHPCNITFKGTHALSEPETLALAEDIRTLINSTDNGIYAYYSIHSYGQLWLLSWGYTEGAYPRDSEKLNHWGRLSTEAIYSVHKKNYTYGQGADMLYGVGGASDDWAKSLAIPYVTTLELRDLGKFGFFLPSDQIIPTAEEAWKGIQVIGALNEDNSGTNNGIRWFFVVPFVIISQYLM